MKPSHWPYVVSSFLALLVTGAGLSARAQHGGHGGGGPAPVPDRPYTEKLRVGADGSVTFKGAAILGNRLIPPGTYRFEHSVEGSEHFVQFRGIGASPDSPPMARVACRLERLKKPAKKTEVYALVNSAGVRELDRIQIQGEDVKHVF